MPDLRKQIERLEKEVRFLAWLESSRLIESFTDEQLVEISVHGRWPEPMPDSPPWGTINLDKLDRKTLLGRFEKDERNFGWPLCWFTIDPAEGQDSLG